MSDLERDLDAWTGAGLITREQAGAIAAFEAAPGPDRRRRSATGPAEALGYVGAALALGALTSILGELWDDLLVGGRLGLVAVLTAAALGAAVALRSARSAAMGRLCSVLFTATVVGVGGLAGVVAVDLLDLGASTVGLTVGCAMVAAALPIHLLTRRGLPQLALLGSILIACVSVLTMPAITPQPPWFGLVIGAVGAVWLLLALGGWLRPRLIAELAGAVVLVVGAQVGASAPVRTAALIVGIVIAGGLVGLAVRTDRLHHLVVGALALFVFSPQLVFAVFGDAIGAPATLLLVGLLLVLLAVGLGRARREVRREVTRSPATDIGGTR